MSRDRFASRETTRVEISDGDWCEFKNYLTFGETTAMSVAMARIQAAALSSGVDVEAAAVTALEIWIVDWSFHQGGKTLPVSRDAIAGLDPDTADEVQSALAKHVAEMNRGKAPRGGVVKLRARSR